MRTTVRRFNDIGGAAPVLGTISNLSATAGDTTIALTWTAAENATSHQPQYRTGANAYADFGAALGGAATSATITGLTNGTAYDVRVIAGDGSTTTTSNVVSRTPAAPVVLGDLDNNLPGTGWTLVTDQNFETWADPMAGGWTDPQNANATWSVATTRSGEDPTTIADATSPSGGTVFRQNYEGVPDGTEPKFPRVTLGDQLESFVGFYVKFAETWTTPTESGLKWHIFNAVQDGSVQSALWFGAGREEGGTPSPSDEMTQAMVFNGQCAEMTEAACGVQEGPGSSRYQLLPTPGTGLMTKGQWHKVQYYLRKGGTGTTGLGIVRIWLNDSLIVDWDGFTWGDPGGTWTTGQFGCTRGGGAIWGGSPPSTSHLAPAGTIIHYDRFMIYSR